MTKKNKPTHCTHCEQPIPSERNSIYCHNNCQRKASYHRKTPRERAEINKRSNDRRMQKDLLPIIRTLLRTSKDAECIEGTPLGRYVVAEFILASQRDWKLKHALHFSQCRGVLSKLAGGDTELHEIEELITEQTLKVMAA